MALFYPLSLAMENFTALVFYLFTLLADTYKIYLRNGRLMAVIAVPIISLQTLFYVFNCFPITPSMTELIMVHTYKLALAAPGTLGFINLSIGLQKEINIFFVITQLIFLPFSVMGSFYFLAYTTNASALIHGGKKITKEDVVSRTTRSFKRPLVTYFYITLFVLGFFSLCLITLVPFMRILGGDPFTPHVSAIVLSVPAAVFYNYLAVVWELALVISIVEEKFGIEALGKAAQIVKGMKLQGFILNLLLTILSLILMLCFGLFNIHCVLLQMQENSWRRS
ncbi:hypothetical protein DITRI_Ditri07aG0019600 [Diplodiscus trichospermus]